MNRVTDFFEWLMSSRQLSWPMLFILGVLAGVTIGFATGLPISGQVVAGTAPLSSIMPDRSTQEQVRLTSQFEDANRPGSLDELPFYGASPSRVTLPAENFAADPVVLAQRNERRVTAAPVSPAPYSAHPQMPEERVAPVLRARPQIALVIDDLGLDQRAFDQVNALPGPLTLAFLPYGANAQAMLDSMAPEHQAILHLPMEPVSNLDAAGPGMLRVSAPAGEIRATLRENLGKLTGYVGVNNHTGSQFTADPVGMAVVLEGLNERDLFFLDSLTTKDRVARRLSESRGWRVLERDVFLDGEWPDVSVASVKNQLAELEKIALAKGTAIGIAHPYQTTLETIGPWLVTAEARGFDLVLVSDLMPPSRRKQVLARLR